MSENIVLVTGGTGFIGRHVVKTLLENGVNVRATVRSAAKGDALKNLFPDHGSQLTTIIVQNHEIATAYDAAVKGVDTVIHMASPLPPLKRQVDNEKEILIPARDGAVNMLKSASKSSSVRRVVLTSSSAAVVDSGVPRNEPVWTESDWNPITWEAGATGTQLAAYQASKTHAEKAAWDFVEKNKPHFDLIALNAPGVFGAPVERPKSISEIEGSNALLLSALDPNNETIPATWSPLYIDVRDMGLAHYKAAIAPAEAGNSRYLIAGPGVGTNKDIREYLVKRYPDRKIAPLSPEAAAEDPKYQFDTSKAQKTLGIKFRSFDEVITDFLDFVDSYKH